MSTWTWIFCLALALGTALQWWLGSRQARYVRTHRSRVPEAFADAISLSDHQKAADYTLARLGLGRWELLLAPIVLLLWTFGGGLNLLDQLWSGTGLSELWQGVGLVVSVLLVGLLLELPVSLWSTFVIEARFGFNRSTPARFVTDQLTGLGLALLLGVPLLAAILWLMAGAGDLWWLAAWALWTSFTLFLVWAYPTLIAPLFNKFEPLDGGELRSRLEALLARCGFRSNGMFVMDGSRRSAHGNAYFTGFGNNKRIVFFDTLLDGLEPAEVEAILAHELGHFRRRHILQQMIANAVLSLGALALLGWLSRQDWFYAGLGVQGRSDALALTLFMLALPVFSVFLTPLFSALSRRNEFQADDYAAEQADARDLISGLVKMYRDNASTLTPDPLYSAFHHSHPPAPVRVAHLSSKLGT